MQKCSDGALNTVWCLVTDQKHGSLKLSCVSVRYFAAERTAVPMC